MTLTEASASVKNPHEPCCAIANGLREPPIAKGSAFALLRRAGVPLRIGVMRLAVPLAAALAILLGVPVARFIDA